jgi:hypothetical protein
MHIADDPEVEFHLASLLVDLRALDVVSSAPADLDVWLYAGPPLVAHATGVCFSLTKALCGEGEAARCAKELALAIAGLRSNRPETQRTLDEISEKHAELVACFADTPIQPWVLRRRALARYLAH